MNDTVKIGISACLLGENVRYDGGHKLDRFLRDTVGRFVEFVPVCPEVECGLPIPRESMHLEGDPESPRLITTRTRIDHTPRMLSWAEKRLEELERENLCGYIFKIKSPSSGMRDISISSPDGVTRYKGSGIWAKLFMERFPDIPAEDDGRLNDPGIRENFFERVFVMKRWRESAGKAGSKRRDLIEFHTAHKLLIMSHSVEAYRELGRLVSGHETGPIHLQDSYFAILLQALKLKATPKKHRNVLHHVMGYFKKDLTGGEKHELLGLIDRYVDGVLPLIVPITMLNHYVAKYGQGYLAGQVYLDPHPVELKLRNHV